MAVAGKNLVLTMRSFKTQFVHIFIGVFFVALAPTPAPGLQHHSSPSSIANALDAYYGGGSYGSDDSDEGSYSYTGNNDDKDDNDNDVDGYDNDNDDENNDYYYDADDTNDNYYYDDDNNKESTIAPSSVTTYAPQPPPLIVTNLTLALTTPLPPPPPSVVETADPDTDSGPDHGSSDSASGSGSSLRSHSGSSGMSSPHDPGAARSLLVLDLAGIIAAIIFLCLSSSSNSNSVGKSKQLQQSFPPSGSSSMGSGSGSSHRYAPVTQVLPSSASSDSVHIDDEGAGRNGGEGEGEGRAAMAPLQIGEHDDDDDIEDPSSCLHSPHHQRIGCGSICDSVSRIVLLLRLAVVLALLAHSAWLVVWVYNNRLFRHSADMDTLSFYFFETLCFIIAPVGCAMYLTFMFMCDLQTVVLDSTY